MDADGVRTVTERFYRGLSGRDLEAVVAVIDEAFAEDFVVRVPQSLPYGGEYGAANLRRMMHVLIQSEYPIIDPAGIVIERMCVSEDQAVVELSFPWGLPGRPRLHTGNIEWLRFRGEKLVAMDVFYRDTAVMVDYVAQAQAAD